MASNGLCIDQGIESRRNESQNCLTLDPPPFPSSNDRYNLNP